MRCYFEIWLRGFAKDYLRGISDKDSETYHPKVTIVRPFDLVSDEGLVKNKVVSYCRGKGVLPFYLEGRSDFDGKFSHVPVFEDGRLREFDEGLEEALEGHVDFVGKIEDSKNFHVTVDDGFKLFNCPRINQYMLRLTAIRDKIIWFSYDFVTDQVLNREQSLDEELWHKTVNMFWKGNI